MLPTTVAGIAASTQSRVLAVFPTQGAKQARFRVKFDCPSEQGFYIAQINWDKGAPYYRLISCEAKNVSFTEATPIPLGASKGLVYVPSRDPPLVQIEKLMVDLL